LLHKVLIELTGCHDKKEISPVLMILSKGHYWSNPTNAIGSRFIPQWAKDSLFGVVNLLQQQGKVILIVGLCFDRSRFFHPQ
jgi:hypothetical protein